MPEFEKSKGFKMKGPTFFKSALKKYNSSPVKHKPNIHEEYSEHDGKSEHFHPVSNATVYSPKGSDQEAEKDKKKDWINKNIPKNVKDKYIEKRKEDNKKSPTKHKPNVHQEYSEHDGTSEHWHPTTNSTAYSPKGGKEEYEKDKKKQNVKKAEIKGKQAANIRKYQKATNVKKTKSAAKMLHAAGKEHTRQTYKGGNPKGMML